MKKLLAVFLAALMLLSVIPMTSFAAEKKDVVVDDILNGEYSHLTYAAEKKYFKAEIATYTALSLYDDALKNAFTGSVDVEYAKEILLAVIDRLEAEYNNETFEEILSVLQGAKTAADLVEKLDSYTGILDLAENASWAKSISAVNAVIKLGTLGNELYEQYIEGYAIVLSCQAASVYYGDLLQFLVDNVNDSAVVKAALELKENITKSLDEARDDLIAKLADTAATAGASIGIDAAMSSNPVTTVISSVYNAIGSFGNTLFKTKEKHMYMKSLALLAKIEEVLPAYVNEVMTGEDSANKDFALVALLTIRETGEEMLAGLGKVKEDAIVEKLLNNSSETISALKKMGAEGDIKLSLYRELIIENKTAMVCEVFVNAEAQKIAKVFNANGDLVATVRDTYIKDMVNPNCAVLSEYNTYTASYAKAIATYAEGYTVNYEAVQSSGGSTSAPAKTGLAGFFQSIIDAFKNLFANLFKKK